MKKQVPQTTQNRNNFPSKVTIKEEGTLVKGPHFEQDDLRALTAKDSIEMEDILEESIIEISQPMNLSTRRPNLLSPKAR